MDRSLIKSEEEKHIKLRHYRRLSSNFLAFIHNSLPSNIPVMFLCLEGPMAPSRENVRTLLLKSAYVMKLNFTVPELF